MFFDFGLFTSLGQTGKNREYKMLKRNLKALIIDERRPVADMIFSYCVPYENEFTTLISHEPFDLISILKNEKNLRIIVIDSNSLKKLGLESLLWVKKFHPKSKVIIVPIQDEEYLRDKTAEFDFVHVLKKSYGMTKLVKKIREILPETLDMLEFIEFASRNYPRSHITFKSDSKKAELHFRDGNPVNASYRKSKGIKAIEKVIEWENPEIEIKESSEAVEANIPEPLPDVLNLIALKVAKETEKEIEKQTVELSETMTAEPEVEEAEAVPEDRPDVLNFEDLDADRWVDYSMRHFPSTDVVLLKYTPIKGMHLTIKNYALFNFLWDLITQIESDDELRAEVEHKLSRKALDKAREKLDNWKITLDEFNDLLWEGFIFQLSRLINPIPTVARFLLINSGHSAAKLSSLLDTMLLQGLLEERFTALKDRIDQFENDEYDFKTIEKEIADFYEKFERNIEIDEIRESMQNLLELSKIGLDYPPESISLDIFFEMLESRGYTELHEYFVEKLSAEKESLEIGEFDEIAVEMNR